MKAAWPDAVPIAGGTDVMVAINFDAIRPAAMLDVSSLPELRQWRRDGATLFLGAGVTYTRIVHELPELVPLVQASRSVGSPQIRNRGTVGGNLGTASPAGDALPVLACYEANVVLGRAGGGVRRVPLGQFLVGVKRTVAEPQELILGAEWPVRAGSGSFSKIGTRNAMVIAVANLCLWLDEDAREVRVALGSVGQTILRTPDAEAFAADALAEAGAWDEPSARISDDVVEGFSERVSEAARPIDDVRGSAAYRRHGCRVLAGRALRWALSDRADRAAAASSNGSDDSDDSNGKGA